MKKTRYTAEQTADALRQNGLGTPSGAEVVRKMGVNQPCLWHSPGGRMTSLVPRHQIQLPRMAIAWQVERFESKSWRYAEKTRWKHLSNWYPCIRFSLLRRSAQF